MKELLLKLAQTLVHQQSQWNQKIKTRLSGRESGSQELHRVCGTNEREPKIEYQIVLGCLSQNLHKSSRGPIRWYSSFRSRDLINKPVKNVASFAPSPRSANFYCKVF